MLLKYRHTGLVLLLCLLGIGSLQARQQDRFAIIEQRLTDLAQQVPALNQKTEVVVSNISLHDCLRGIAATHNLNFNVDPALTQRVTVYLADETVKNVLLYLIKQHNLDLTFTGSIITISAYRNPLDNLPPPPKEVRISYNAAGQVITMDLQDDSLSVVARKITQLTNRNIMVLPPLAAKKVTAYIQNLPLVNALEKVAMTNSFNINQTKDSVIMLEPLAANEQIVPKKNGLADPNFSVRSVSTYNPQSSSSVNVSSDKEGRKLISLTVVNAPVKEVVRNIAEEAGINYFVYSELTGNITATVQNQPFDDVLELVLKSSDYAYAVNKGIYLIGKRQEEGLRSYKVIQLKYRSVDSLLAIIPDEIKKGVTIKEFRELNSLLLNGSNPQIREIEAFVTALDKTVPMVMIEVILMDVRKSRSIETGLKLGVSDSARSGGTLLGGTDFTFSAGDINRFIDAIGLNNVFNIGRVSPNFYASLKLLESNSNIDLRQTPKLSTLNGHTANLSIGSKRYYVVKTQNVLGALNSQTVVTEQYNEVEANLSVAIRPFVSGDEHVTLNIDIEISDFIGELVADKPPPTASSVFKSIIRVKNEEMVVLGGIERTEKSDGGSGTPFLSRIPVLKWFFSTRSRTNSKTVSIVFIKPSIFY